MADSMVSRINFFIWLRTFYSKVIHYWWLYYLLTHIFLVVSVLVQGTFVTPQSSATYIERIIGISTLGLLDIYFCNLVLYYLRFMSSLLNSGKKLLTKKHNLNNTKRRNFFLVMLDLVFALVFCLLLFASLFSPRKEMRIVYLFFLFFYTTLSNHIKMVQANTYYNSRTHSELGKNLNESLLNRCIISSLIDYKFYTAVLFPFLGILTIGYLPETEYVLSLFVVFITPLFFIVFKDCYRREGFGKRKLHLRIIDADTFKEATRGQRIVRNLPYLFFPIEFVYLVFSKSHTRLGDKLAHTRVVDKNSPLGVLEMPNKEMPNKETMSTSNNKTQKASVEKRMIAVTIDFFILAIFQALIMGILLFSERVQTMVSFYSNPFVVVLVESVLVMVLFSFRDIVGGSSLGKRVTKIAVRSSNDPQKQLHPLLSIIRNLTLIIAAVDIFVYLLSRDNRRLGDRIVGADVVEV